MNKSFVNGRLTADPEVRDANGSSVTHFTVASDTSSKDANGDYITIFYRCSVWGKRGETCAKYLHKGDRVTVVGEMVPRTYTDKNGQARFSIEIPFSDTVDILFDKKPDVAAPAAKPAAKIAAADTEDDLPF